MVKSLEPMEKEGQINHFQSNTYHLVKIVKISPVDPDNIGLQLKKDKLMQAKHIAPG